MILDMSVLQRRAAATNTDSTQSSDASDSRGPGLVAVNAIFTAMSILFVGARLFRCAKTRKFLLEDALIVIALLSAIAVTVIFGITFARGGGKHIWQIKPEDMNTLFFVSWLSDPIACYAFMTSKFSVGITMLRLGFSKTFRTLVCITMVIAALFNLWPSTAQFVGCNAWKYFADPSLKCTRGSELDVLTLLYIQSGGNIAVDIIYVVLLEVHIRRVKLSLRDRFAVRTVLVFMLVATVCCVVKTILFHSTLTSKDITYDVMPVAELSVAEIHLALSAACLPAVRLLFGRYFPKRLMFWKQSLESTEYCSGTASGIGARSKTGGGGTGTGSRAGGAGVHKSRINKTETVVIQEEDAGRELDGQANKVDMELDVFPHKDDDAWKDGRISHGVIAKVGQESG